MAIAAPPPPAAAGGFFLALVMGSAAAAAVAGNASAVAMGSSRSSDLTKALSLAKYSLRRPTHDESRGRAWRERRGGGVRLKKGAALEY